MPPRRMKWVHHYVPEQDKESTAVVGQDGQSPQLDHGDKNNPEVKAAQSSPLKAAIPHSLLTTNGSKEAKKTSTHDGLTLNSPQQIEETPLPHQQTKDTFTKTLEPSPDAHPEDQSDKQEVICAPEKQEVAHVATGKPSYRDVLTHNSPSEHKQPSPNQDRREMILQNVEKQAERRRQAAEAKHAAQKSAMDKAKVKQQEAQEQLKLAIAQEQSEAERLDIQEAQGQEKKPGEAIRAVSSPISQQWESPQRSPKVSQSGLSQRVTPEASGLFSPRYSDFTSVNQRAIDAWNHWDPPLASHWQVPSSAEWGPRRSTPPVDNGRARRDIRGGDLTMSAIRVDWNAVRGTKESPWKSDSIVLQAERHLDSDLNTYVSFWMADIPKVTVKPETLGLFENWLCDINAENGELLRPIEYPNTLPCPHDLKREVSRGFAGANAEYTAEIINLRLQKSLWKRSQEEHRREADRLRESMFTSSTDNKPASVVGSVNSTNVRIPCHLRPALYADMPAVTGIYDGQVQSSHRTLDCQDVSVAAFQKLFDKCEKHHMPFLVAVEGHRDDSRGLSVDGKIIGFALVDTLEQGIGGSRYTCAATCGRVTLIVHPAYRRQRIGTAMMDVIMASCSNSHVPWEGYQWINPGVADRRFARPLDNLKPWYNLFIEVFFKNNGWTKNEINKHEEWWVCEWLESRFRIFLVDHQERLYRHTSDDQKGTYWLDRLTLRHKCRDWNT